MLIEAPPPTNRHITNADLLQYLKSRHFEGGLVDRIKVYYRPLVCPFVDLIKLVNPGEKVGDIGCGSGQFCLLLAQFSNPSFIYGIEISDKLVSNANALFNQNTSIDYSFEKFDGLHFSNRIADLDVIFLNDVLHHVPKKIQREFMKNLIDKMKVGARLVLKDINAESAFVYCNKMHDLVFAREIGNEIPFSTAKAWIEEYGMKIIYTIKKRMYVYPHYTIVAQKK